MSTLTPSPKSPRQGKRAGTPRPRVLVIDIGGNNVKLAGQGRGERAKVPSGPKLTPTKMVKAVKHATRDWSYDVISIGYPGPVKDGRAAVEPKNLGRGWVGFDFEKAFRRPVRILNDAAMQALGSYHGGWMLFVGLGTGMGTAMVVDGRVHPMELGHLPYRAGLTYEDHVGQKGLDTLGREEWREYVKDIVERLVEALQVDYVVIGGGNVKKLDKLPAGARRGSNANAFEGGRRMWRDPA